jgi:hypothetical protein
MGLRWRECSSLRDVFELISDGLNDGSFAEKEFIRPVEQTVVHLFAQLGDEVQPLGHQELLSQRQGEIAFGAFEFADEPCDQFGNGTPIIDIAWGQAKGQQLALIIDDQVQLEAKEPADRGLATCGAPFKHAMLVDACIVANSEWSGVDEADAATAAQLRVQIGYQWNQHGGHQLDEALVAHQGGKLPTPMALHVFSVIRFERAIVGVMEQDDDGHDLGFDTSGLGASAVVVPMSASHDASSGQTAARNRPPNKTVQVYSWLEPAFG